MRLNIMLLHWLLIRFEKKALFKGFKGIIKGAINAPLLLDKAHVNLLLFHHY